MSLDLHSVAVFAAVLSLLLALFMRVVSRSYPTVWRPALDAWVGGLLALPAGFALLSARDQFPHAVAQALTVSGNAALLTGFALMAVASHRFGGVRARRGCVWGPLSLAILASAGFTYLHESYTARTVIGSAVVAWLLWQAARPLSGHLRRGGRMSHRLTASVFLFAMAATAARAVWETIPALQSSDLFDASSMRQALLLYMPIAPVLATFGFVMMCADRASADLERLASVDPLTGAWNRRALQELARRGLSLDRRHCRPSALLLVDVDHFKRINDTFGHAAGDVVLEALVHRMHGLLRAGDVVGRLGGEEFVVFLPCTDGAGAREVAERLRLAVQAEAFHCEGRAIPATVSVGIGERLPGEADLAALLQRADRALYAAKHAGRNRVAVASSLQAVPALA